MRSRLVTLLIMLFTGSVTENAALEIAIGDAGVVEGNSGDRPVLVTVVLSEPAPGQLTVPYTTRDGSAIAGVDYRQAAGCITFVKGEIRQRITVNVIGDTVQEPDKTFSIVLDPSAARLSLTTCRERPAVGPTVSLKECPSQDRASDNLTDCLATVTIVDDDFPGSSTRPTGSGFSAYEVRMTFVGSLGTIEGAPGCVVRQNGRAVLTGIVRGNDKVGPSDDIIYQGRLQLDVDLDLCEVRPSPGNDRECRITVIGSGPVNVELKVREGDRGAYIKFKAAAGGLKNVSGDCEPGLMDEERNTFPDNSMAAVFNGIDLPLKSGPLKVGKYVEDRMVVEVLRVIR